MKTIFDKLLRKETLTEDESYGVFNDILEAGISHEQISAFLSLLKMKGEQPEEIVGAARLMRDKSTRINATGKILCDTCGTGGDNSGTFNISTCAALLAFSCGLKVAKHGNRSVTSKCGSADVLEAMGYKIDMPVAQSRHLLKTRGFAFLFAPLYHKAMKNVMPVRRELPFRTIFNIIGPLCNPAKTNVQIMGVSEYSLLKIIPSVFRKLGINGYVFHSADGLDEISLTGKTYLAEVLPDSIREFEIYPQDFDFKKCALADIKGGTAEENSKIISDILNNVDSGPKRDVVVLNTSFLLTAAGAVKTIKEGRDLCIKTIEQGISSKKLKDLLEEIQRYAQD